MKGPVPYDVFPQKATGPDVLVTRGAASAVTVGRGSTVTVTVEEAEIPYVSVSLKNAV